MRRPRDISSPARFGGSSARRFRRAESGAVAIETALALLVLVTALAGLLEIVHTVYTRDTLARAARAAAGQVALLAQAPASASALDSVVCGAIRRELDLASDFDCAGAWTITVDAYATPADLLAGTTRPSGSDASPGGENGDMVVVRIARKHAGWLLGWLADSANADDADPEPASIVAMAVARNEREVTVTP